MVFLWWHTGGTGSVVALVFTPPVECHFWPPFRLCPWLPSVPLNPFVLRASIYMAPGVGRGRNPVILEAPSQSPSRCRLLRPA
jgi:hypothetical protein